MRGMTLARVLIGGLALLALVAVGAGGDGAPRVIRSASGMEGMSEVAVEVHVAGGDDWRELADVDEGKLQRRVEELLRAIPGLTVVEGDVPEQTPRVLVTAVGHLIADPEGNQGAVATNLTMGLNQQVSLRRPVPGGVPVLAMGTTWQESVLLTGVKQKMRVRVAENLASLAAEFKDDYARANP